MKFDQLLPACDCCGVSLQEAALHLGPAFVYDLYIHPSAILYTKDMIKKLMADVADNPMAPFINIFVDDRLDRPHTWYLCANGKAVGSKGV